MAEISALVTICTLLYCNILSLLLAKQKLLYAGIFKIPFRHRCLCFQFQVDPKNSFKIKSSSLRDIKFGDFVTGVRSDGLVSMSLFLCLCLKTISRHYLA